MTELTLERFMYVVRRSQLIAERDLHAFEKSLHSLPEEEIPKTPQEMAQRLIEAKLINAWQASNLLQGKYRGFTLGKYTLKGHLGTGGMSSVYLAEHPVMERLVAIKVLPKKYVENPNYLDRFRREARAAAQLDHPNIVHAYDIDQDGDTHYIVMEYVEGRDLQVLVREKGPLDFHEAADFIAQAALGLQHAHEAGLIHRDVKPANCLVDKRGVLKILDMGLAKFSQDDRPGLSEIYDDSVVGTADYLAPEQAVNSQKVDARADIYSLGCTLYFLLTGRPPFPEGSIATRLLKHQTEEPTSLFKLRPEVPHALADICRRMMSKLPQDRIQSAAQVAEELSNWLASRGKQSAYLRSQALAVTRGGPSDSARALPPRGTSSTTTLPKEVPPPERRHPHDTVPSSRGDTSRIGMGDSSVNDNLTLVPLEEEKKPETAASESKASKSGPSSSLSNPRMGSSVIDPALIRAYESGPLDSLLKDKQFAQPGQFRKQLAAKKEKSRAPMIMLITILTLFGVAVLILIVSIIVFSM